MNQTKMPTGEFVHKFVTSKTGAAGTSREIDSLKRQALSRISGGAVTKKEMGKVSPLRRLARSIIGRK